MRLDAKPLAASLAALKTQGSVQMVVAAMPSELCVVFFCAPFWIGARPAALTAADVYYWIFFYSK